MAQQNPSQDPVNLARNPAAMGPHGRGQAAKAKAKANPRR